MFFDFRVLYLYVLLVLECRYCSLPFFPSVLLLLLLLFNFYCWSHEKFVPEPIYLCSFDAELSCDDSECIFVMAGSSELPYGRREEKINVIAWFFYCTVHTNLLWMITCDLQFQCSMYLVLRVVFSEIK